MISLESSWLCYALISTAALTTFAWRSKRTLRKKFAKITGILSTIQVLLGYTVIRRDSWPLLHPSVYFYLQLAAFMHLFSMARGRLRPMWWRVLFSIPGTFWIGACLFHLPLAPFVSILYRVQRTIVPAVNATVYLLTALGVYHSITNRKEHYNIVIPHKATHSSDNSNGSDKQAEQAKAPLLRVRSVSDVAALQSRRRLTFVQLSDTHIGPYMSVNRLKKIAQDAVDLNPDFIFLTGDFFSMEGHNEAEGALTAALSPLKEMAQRGRVISCIGNHDYEVYDEVVKALAANHIPLLVDSELVVETESGPVQITGVDFSFSNAKEHIKAIFEKYPRKRIPTTDSTTSSTITCPRIVLLHNPAHFRHIPDGEADIVLGGHFHGGQIGLHFIGFDFTVVGLIKQPDHGLFALRNSRTGEASHTRCYAHRGTGFYGFPLRVGVQGEETLVTLYFTPEGERA